MNRLVTRFRSAFAVLVLPLGALCLLAASSAALQPAPEAAKSAAESRDFPAVASGSPKPAEWQSSQPFDVSRRVGSVSAHCETRRVREWIRVRCPALRVSAITQLGGSAEGARLNLDPKSADGLPAGGELAFPIRPGESRVFLFWTLGEGYDGPLTVIPAIVVQSEWAAAQPVIVVHDALNEPVRTAQGERRRQQGTPPSPPPK